MSQTLPLTATATHWLNHWSAYYEPGDLGKIVARARQIATEEEGKRVSSHDIDRAVQMLQAETEIRS
jgi:hypothetical protein